MRRTGIFISAGAKLLTVSGEQGRISPDSIEYTVVNDPSGGEPCIQSNRAKCAPPLLAGHSERVWPRRYKIPVRRTQSVSIMGELMANHAVIALAKSGEGKGVGGGAVEKVKNTSQSVSKN